MGAPPGGEDAIRSPARPRGPKGGQRDTLNIGDLAQQANVSTRTIRYYEELGILPPPIRTTGGTRRYSQDHLFYLEGARVLKQLGLGLTEIAELGRYALSGAAASAWTKAFLQEKVSELDHKIRVLTRLYELVKEAASSSGASPPPVPELLRWVSERNGDFAQNGPDEAHGPSRS